MKKIFLKVLVASVLFVGLLPMMIFWRENYIFIATLFLLSVIGYAIAEVVLGAKQAQGKKDGKQDSRNDLKRESRKDTKRDNRKDASVEPARLSALINMLFLAIIFLALAVLVKQWLSASWTEELQLGFLMLSATYYSVTLMQLAFLRH